MESTTNVKIEPPAGDSSSEDESAMLSSTTEAVVHNRRLMAQRPRPGVDFFSDDEDRKEPVFPLPAIHMRGSSADSTLTGDSSLMQQARAHGAAHVHQTRPYQRPRRASPRKKLQPLFSPQQQMMPPPKKVMDLGGCDELQE